jgi:hypothetical protein
MRILVLYESDRGFTLSVARAIRDEIRARGHEASTAPVRSVDVGTVVAADALIVGSWVTGKIVFGVGPAPGALAGIARLPHLRGRPAAVFCTCRFSARTTLNVLASRLAAHGARVLAGEVFRKTRRSSRRLEKVPMFVDEVLPLFASAIETVS